MKAFSDFVLRHKALVVVFWAVVMVAGGIASGQLNDKFKEELNFPGQDGYKANQEIVKKYGNGGAANPLIPIIEVDEGDIRENAQLVSSFGVALDGLSAQGVRAVSYPQTQDESFITNDGKAMFAIIAMPMLYDPVAREELVENITTQIQSQLPNNVVVRSTGLEELATSKVGGEESSSGALIETLVGAGGALVILLFVFASFMAIVPLIVAAVSILTTFLAIYGIALFTDVSAIVQFIISLIGLGIAIDYSLLVVTRWREERAKGLNKVAATHEAMRTAGRSVIFSGAAVATGLLVLVLLPVPFLRSLGVGSVLIPLFSVLVSLTLLPALLATIGDKLDWPRLRKEQKPSRIWTKWAHGVVRRPALATLAALALLAPLIVAAFTMQLGQTPSDSLNKTGTARQALSTLQDNGVPSGVLTPIEVLVPRDVPVNEVVDELQSMDGVHAVLLPQQWQRTDVALVEVIPKEETMTTDGRELVNRVAGTMKPFEGVMVGGSGAMLIASIDSIYGNFPLMLGLISVITFVLLVRAFRSIVLALQAIIVNLLSIGAAYGVLVLIWQEGFGSELIWDIEALGSVTSWVPLITFAFLFGLSMDYQVFLLSRMREQYDQSGSTTDAIVTGLGRIGRLVTCAALILFLAFMSMAALPEVDLKVMATGMGAAILLDATVIRMLLVPALTALMGRWNWWLPAKVARILRVSASTPITAASAATDDQPVLAR
ncbi:MAG: MMPL family transporter [Corynebacteriales bacterium]|nr:MMPL family transporter [Mycobacteriales bacterium]